MALDAHERPPEALRHVYKRYQSLSREHEKDILSGLDSDQHVLDFARGLTGPQRRVTGTGNLEGCLDLVASLQDYLGENKRLQPVDSQPLLYRHNDFPGLAIVPSLIPIDLQKEILARTFHRELSSPAHTTNVHFHHNLFYPDDEGSFFEQDPASVDHVLPKDANSHRPMSLYQLLTKKLRWITLGGQYDWTEKKYPNEDPPEFPPDLKKLLQNLFPMTNPEAAIVNLYSPGDVLALHRDVSEYCDNGLISASIGCDGLFIIALADGSASESSCRHLTIRLRSGDVVYMSGPSRYAWHGVPLVVRGTCPQKLQHWPANEAWSDIPGQWNGWLASKRINLNVRQMRPTPSSDACAA